MGTELFQGREVVKAIGNVRIEDGAVSLCHFQGGVSQELLQSKGIAPTVQQIFSGKGVAEHVNGGSLYASLLIIAHNGKPKGIFCQHLSMFKSQERIYETKKELNDYIETRGGEGIVFNGDNAFTEKMYSVSSVREKTLISSSRCENHGEDSAYIRIDNAVYDSDGIKFTLYIGKDCF